jgi:tetratricopeptide (TPR) repeat protein
VAGGVQSSIGEARRAELLLYEALWAAESSGLDRLRLRVLVDLTYVVGHMLRDRERGRWFADTAMHVQERVGADDEQRMQLLVSRGVLASGLAEHEEALRLFEEALALHERMDGPKENRSTILGNLGSVHYERGEFQVALSYYERALALDTAHLGPTHPRVANTITNCANAQQALGHFDEALVLHRDALEVLDVAGANRGPIQALGLNNVGVVLSGMQRWGEAATYYEQARAVLEAESPQHPMLDVVLLNLAETALHRGRVAQALAEYERAHERLRRTLGERHPYVAIALAGVGIAQLELGRFDRARPSLEESLAIHAAVGGDAVQIAEARVALARVLSQSGRAVDRRRALEIAKSARDALVPAGARAEPALARAERVIADLAKSTGPDTAR